MRLAQISNRLAKMAEDRDVTARLSDASTRLGQVSEKVYDRMGVAGEAARQRALAAYRTALAHPKTSVGGIIIAAALVGGVLWYLFGDTRRTPVQRRKHGTRMRAGTERRRKGRAASRPATA